MVRGKLRYVGAFSSLAKLGLQRVCFSLRGPLGPQLFADVAGLQRTGMQAAQP